MLDDECNTPNGSDAKFVSKMHDAFANKMLMNGKHAKEFYSPPKYGAAAVGADLGKEFAPLQFVVQHYAMAVQYTAHQWLERNRGRLHSDLAALVGTSKSPLLQLAFEVPTVIVDDEKGKKKIPTVGATFRASLRALSATILTSHQHFVRCIKPNEEKVPQKLNGEYVARQLRYLGVHAVVEINRLGYPIKYPDPDFRKRYRCIAFHLPDQIADELDDKTVCTNILRIAQELAGPDTPDWLGEKLVQVGKTKGFMRTEVLKFLERPRKEARSRAAVCAQKYVRRRIARRVIRLLAAHCGQLVNVRNELDRPDEDRRAEAILERLGDAGAELDALGIIWEKMGVAVGAAPLTLGWRKEQIENLEMEIRTHEHNVVAEQEAYIELRKIIDATSATNTSKEAFLALKAATGKAKQVTCHITQELSDAIAETDAAIDERFAAMVESWEQELRIEEAKREALRKKECAAKEDALANDENTVLITLTLRNGMDSESTEPRQMTGYSVASTGLAFNDMNCVSKIVPGRPAALDGAFRLGDVIIGINLLAPGAPAARLRGVKAADAMGPPGHSITAEEAKKSSEFERSSQGGSRTQFELLVARPKVTIGSMLSSLPGGEVEGWLQVVRAKPFGSGLAPLHPSRKMWVVVQGGILTIHEEVRRGEERVPTALPLKGAVCKSYSSKKLGARGGNLSQPLVITDMQERGLHPFRISWPDGEQAFDLVLGCSDTASRTSWTKALDETIKLLNENSPTSGWLEKKKGRKDGGLMGAMKGAMGGWNKKWFVLTPAVPPHDPHGRPPADATFRYYDGPDDKVPKGVVVLNKGAMLLSSAELSYKDKPFVLAINSQGETDKQMVSTVLACTNGSDLDKWTAAVKRAIRAFQPHAIAQAGASSKEKTSKEEIALKKKTCAALCAMLEYMGVEYDKQDANNKEALVFAVMKQRNLNQMVRHAGGEGGEEGKGEMIKKIKKEEARLHARTIDELKALLEYLDVTFDPDLEDKERLVALVINQKNLVPVAENLKEKFKGWKQRSQSGSNLCGGGGGGSSAPSEPMPTIASQKVADGGGASGKSAADSQKEKKPKPKPKQTKYHLGGDDEDF